MVYLIKTEMPVAQGVFGVDTQSETLLKPLNALHMKSIRVF